MLKLLKKTLIINNFKIFFTLENEIGSTRLFIGRITPEITREDIM